MTFDLDVLLLVGEDGVPVRGRESWKEAACLTLSAYDRKRNRRRAIHLEAMSEKKATMTERLTKVIQGVLGREASKSPRLAYVIDAVITPRGYLDRHRSYMDCTTRQQPGDPIGSGIAEAGCKVIFNQRTKQHGYSQP